MRTDIREALLQQCPSLTLQRAAGDEIAKLDAYIKRLELIILSEDNNIVEKALNLIKNDSPFS